MFYPEAILIRVLRKIIVPCSLHAVIVQMSLRGGCSLCCEMKFGLTCSNEHKESENHLEQKINQVKPNRAFHSCLTRLSGRAYSTFNTFAPKRLTLHGINGCILSAHFKKIDFMITFDSSLNKISVSD